MRNTLIPHVMPIKNDFTCLWRLLSQLDAVKHGTENYQKLIQNDFENSRYHSKA